MENVYISIVGKAADKLSAYANLATDMKAKDQHRNSLKHIAVIRASANLTRPQPQPQPLPKSQPKLPTEPVPMEDMVPVDEDSSLDMMAAQQRPSVDIGKIWHDAPCIDMPYIPE